MTRKLAIIFFLLTALAPTAIAQADKWTGTWQIHRQPWSHIPAIIMELQIGAPDQGMLYPAKIKLQYGQFCGIYEVLLAKKNDRQLGIGRGKYPLQETPFKLGVWMMYLNGTLDYKDAKISLNRMWIDRFNIWMRGLYDDDEIFVNSKVMLRDFLYRDSITLKKINNIPWTDPHIHRILHPENEDIYYGIYDRVESRDSTVILQVEDQEKYDKDTITLLHNGRPLFNKAEVNEQNRRQSILLDTGRNLFTFFADNYGGIPPNTGNLYMKIGDKEYGFDFSHRSNAYATFLVAQVYYHAPGNKTLTDRAAERTTTPVATIPVDTADIMLELWDGQVEDGDSISLRLNGQWIATGFPVKNRLQKIPVNLQRGENVLLFMADNLGRIPPNTAELRIRYGGKTKTLGLSTDMKKNNEIRLILE